MDFRAAMGLKQNGLSLRVLMQELKTRIGNPNHDQFWHDYVNEVLEFL